MEWHKEKYLHGWAIADQHGRNRATVFHESDADMIVEALNAYDPMVAAMEKAKTLISELAGRLSTFGVRFDTRQKEFEDCINSVVAGQPDKEGEAK